ncbi:MAG: hypothetical protein CL559_15555 [Alphaproteobacteria bacterium]|nr:hypothetical protein [Alphaproteobacteria bacterium]
MSEAAQPDEDRPRHRLILLRHAKSAWDQPELADHDRPLAPRGVRAAKSMGLFMAEQGLLPDLILCSSATRALDTLELAERKWSTSITAEIDRGLYLCGVEGFIRRLRQVETAPRSIMIIAHNPDLHDFGLSLLSPADMDSEGAIAMRRKYPTAALAVFDLDIPDWSALPDAPTGDLALFRTPKSLMAMAG